MTRVAEPQQSFGCSIVLVVPAIRGMVSNLGAAGVPRTEEFAVDAGRSAADLTLMDRSAALDAVADAALHADLLRRRVARGPRSTAVRLDV